MGQFSLFLVDSSALFRTGAKQILGRNGYHVVGEAPSLAAASLALESLGKVDAIIFDIAPSEADTTADHLQKIRSRTDGIRVVLLTSDLSAGTLMKAMSWSVDAYLAKDMCPEALAKSLQLVMLGQQIFPTRLMASLLPGGSQKSATSMVGIRNKGLSPRENQILGYVMDGQSNKTIARELDISNATVKAHMKTLLQKIGANNRTQAAVWARDSGFTTT